MSLEFATCTGCATSHAVMRNGEMSIHSDYDGMRCSGSGDPNAHIKRKAAAAAAAVEERERRTAERARRDAERARRDAERAEKLARAERAKQQRELQKAQVIAAEQKFRRYVSAQMSGKVDRGIYATRGARIVPGGLPTLGRGADAPRSPAT